MIKKSKHKYRSAYNYLNKLDLAVLIFIIFCAIVGTLTVDRLIENRIKASVAMSLNTILSSTNKAIDIWSRDQIYLVKQLSRQEDVVEITQSLLSEPRNQESLVASNSQKHLRMLSTDLIREGKFKGYFIISPDNINLASSRDINIGSVNLLTKQPDVLQKLWTGKTTFSHIQTSDVKLSEEDDDKLNDTMFVGSPIRNASGNIIALLTLRLDPYTTLYPILEVTRLGLTGESYIFDSQGYMLSTSRFLNQIKSINILNQHSSRIRIADPGVNLLEEVPSNKVVESWPLTKMANSAIAKRDGLDIEGYRDYRGVNVVGAWAWNNQLDIGITTEQSLTEAYTVLAFTSKLLNITAVISALVFLFAFLIKGYGRNRALSAEIKHSVLVETAVDGILTISSKGIIENVNEAVIKLFGYDNKELIGKNVKMLMPEPFHSEHDGYLKNYFDTGKEKILSRQVETLAQRKDGSIFPVVLSVSRLDLDDGVHFSGIIRDITFIKQNAQIIEDEKNFTRDVIDALQANIAVLDHNGDIVMTNHAWDQFGVDNGLVLEKFGIGCNYLQSIKHSTDEDIYSVGMKLQAILAHQLNTFTLTYPCHAPNEERWFEMRANSFKYKENIAVVVSHTNITQQIISENALQRVNSELSTMSLVAKNTDDAVIVTDADGLIKWVNAGFTKVSEYQLDEVIGKKPGHLLQGPETSKKTIQIIRENLSLGRRVQVEILNYSRSGKPYWIDIEIVPLFDDNDTLIEFVALEKDITQRKENEKQLIVARKLAEEANRSKSTFLATMSHEIRTPLNGIVGTIDMLKYTKLDNYQEDMINTALNSSNQLKSIIDDVLDFSKIEAGRLELEEVPLDLESLLESLGSSLHQFSIEKEVDFLIYCEPDLPMVIGDPVRLNQILFNLAGNAIKFSSKEATGHLGKVFIAIEKEQQDQGLLQVSIKVKDNGIGMSEDVLDSLFESFSQADQDTTRRFGGTGLGLVITKRLVELMKGSISVNSQPNDGSEFTISIAFETAIQNKVYSDLVLDGLNVYLVENQDQDINFILLKYLQHAGATIQVKTAEQVLTELNERKCVDWNNTVVVFDESKQSAEINLIKENLQKDTSCDISYVIIDKNGSRYAQSTVNNGLKLDLNIMERGKFINAVGSSTGRVSPLYFSEHSESDITMKIPESRTQAITENRLILLVDDNETNLKVIIQQLNMLGFMVDSAENGLKALDMWRKTPEYSAIFTDCHMPIMDGYELTIAIRAEESSDRKIPIIAITADALKGTAQKCYNAGMNDYLTKPMTLDEILVCLEKWLNIKQVNIAKQNDLLLHDKANLSPVDKGVLIKLLGSSDSKMLADFYQIFLLDSTQTISDIKKAYKNKNIVQLGKLGHKLKSSARTLGANDLADCCVAIETSCKQHNIPIVDQLFIELLDLFKSVDKWIKENS